MAESRLMHARPVSIAKVSEEYKTKIYEYLCNPMRSGLSVLDVEFDDDARARVIKKVSSVLKDDVLSDSENRRMLWLFGDNPRIDINLQTVLYISAYYAELINKDRLSYRFEDLLEAIDEKKFHKEFGKVISKLKKVDIEALEDPFRLYLGTDRSRFSSRPYQIVISGALGLIIRSADANQRVYSFSTEMNEIILDLFKAIDTKVVAKSYKVHSPIEDLLIVYPKFLSIYLKMSGQRNLDKFQILLTYFSNADYLSCVINAGIMVEECLKELYESITREPVKKNRTIGALIEDISSAIKGAKDTHDEVVLDTDSLIQQIEDIYGSKKMTVNEKNLKSHTVATAFIRKAMKRNTEVLEKRIKEIENKLLNTKSDYNTLEKIVPSNVLRGLEDVVYNRNSASHSSVNPIVEMHSLKSIHGCFNFIDWWNNCKYNMRDFTSAEFIEFLVQTKGTEV